MNGREEMPPAQAGRSASAGKGAGEQVDRTKAGLADYPDLPLSASVPREPVTPEFLIEHRSALNNQLVEVCGIIVGEARADAQGGGDFLPRLFLASTPADDRDRNYDLMVLLGEGESAAHKPGEDMRVKGRVGASKVAVYLRKTY